MTPSDADDLLQHLRLALRSSGLADIDAEVIPGINEEAAESHQRLLIYLDRLDTQLQLRSRRTVRRVVDRLNDVCDTESGSPIQDVLVIDSATPTPFSLSSLPDLTAQLDTLRRLRLEIAES